MARHFWQLYVLIVVTLVGASWVQDRLSHVPSQSEASVDAAQAALLDLLIVELTNVAPDERERVVSDLARKTRQALELFTLQDIAGATTLERLQRGEPAVMRAGNDQTWLLRRIDKTNAIIAFKFRDAPAERSGREWTLTFAFYAAIALVIMGWLWPLTRDLRELERATTRFGDRNWRFDAAIGPGSQVHSLAQAFKRMAARIDDLISSHKDMTNAMSHEIKTPLARMRFEVEVARSATSPEQFHQHLDHINTDIAELNSFVSATLDYAILERAEVALNLAAHDFTQILPAVADHLRRTTRAELRVDCEVAPSARVVRCDVHLMETVVRNLLYNAARYANQQITIRFEESLGVYCLTVEDDGPGIPATERERVFESFVQLEQPTNTKSGFGLGLAIVRRIVEWHRGMVTVEESPLGGARFQVRWPV